MSPASPAPHSLPQIGVSISASRCTREAGTLASVSLSGSASATGSSFSARHRSSAELSAGAASSPASTSRDERDAQQAGGLVAALGVTAEPVEIFDDSRGKLEAAAYQIGFADRVLEQAEGVDRGIGEHPGILARAAALHRDDARVRFCRYARQSARHHHVARRRGGDVDAQANAARQQAPLVPVAPRLAPARN
jgi:hypothetical protein